MQAVQKSMKLAECIKVADNRTKAYISVLVDPTCIGVETAEMHARIRGDCITGS